MRRIQLRHFIFLMLVLSIPMLFIFMGNAFVRQTGPMAINVLFFIFWPGICLTALIFGETYSITFIIIIGLLINLVYWSYLYRFVIYLINRFREVI